MDLGAISIGRPTARSKDMAGTNGFDQTSIRKESCCAGSADLTIGRDQDLTRRKGNGVSRVFTGNLWAAFSGDARCSIFDAG
jgi:hypothetical protein